MTDASESFLEELFERRVVADGILGDVLLPKAEKAKEEADSEAAAPPGDKKE